MTQEIHSILNIHNSHKKVLGKYLHDVCVNIVAEYLSGFVQLGELNTPSILLRTFNEINYTTFQIKYIYNLYFFDFWRVESYDWGGDFYTKTWTISHYSYIYKNGVLLRDRIKFVIDSSPGNLDPFNPSYPIYNIKKLKKEHFTEFNCSIGWINSLNIMSSVDLNNFENIELLFKLFSDLTEGKPQLFYENHIRFNLL
jgi:hypothetical protein